MSERSKTLVFEKVNKKGNTEEKKERFYPGPNGKYDDDDIAFHTKQRVDKGWKLVGIRLNPL